MIPVVALYSAICAEDAKPFDLDEFERQLERIKQFHRLDHVEMALEWWRRVGRGRYPKIFDKVFRNPLLLHEGGMIHLAMYEIIRTRAHADFVARNPPEPAAAGRRHRHRKEDGDSADNMDESHLPSESGDGSGAEDSGVQSQAPLQPGDGSAVLLPASDAESGAATGGELGDSDSDEEGGGDHALP